MAIDFWSSRNLANMEDIKRKCNLMVNLSKFTSNKNTLSEVVALCYNQFCSQTSSLLETPGIHSIKSYKIEKINMIEDKVWLLTCL